MKSLDFIYEKLEEMKNHKQKIIFNGFIKMNMTIRNFNFKIVNSKIYFFDNLTRVVGIDFNEANRVILIGKNDIEIDFNYNEVIKIVKYN